MKRIYTLNNSLNDRLILLIIVFFVSFLIHPVNLEAQPNTISQKEEDLKILYGIERLQTLNQLSVYYKDINERKAYRFARQAVLLGENVVTPSSPTYKTDFKQLALAYFQLGEILYMREKYWEAKVNFDSTQSISLKNNYTEHSDQLEFYLRNIDMKADSGMVKRNLLSKTVGNLNLGKTINETSRNLNIQTELKIAETNEKKGDFQGAINHYEKAVNLLRNSGDAERIRNLQLKIAVLLDSMDNHVEAQKLLNSAITEIEHPEYQKQSYSDTLIRDSLVEMKKIEISSLFNENDSLKIEKQNLKDLSESYLREKNYEKSLEFLKMYQELSIKMEADSLAAVMAQQKKEDEILLLKQQKEIADLNVQKQVRSINSLILIAIIIFVGILIILYFYVSKRKEHKKLIMAYSDLDRTSKQLEIAEKRIVNLLKQQVSGDIAQELLTNDLEKPGEKRFACIMFLDIRDFTPLAEKLDPVELISYQNSVFGFMIDIIQQYHGNINQLLGDGFMATFGAPVSHKNDCENAYQSAKKILEELENRIDKKLIKKTRIGIGLHAGYVVTGNVGNEERKQFSVTGNPVIIASRVEQLNKKYNSRLVITEEVFNKLENGQSKNPVFIEEKIKGRQKPVRILKFD